MNIVDRDGQPLETDPDRAGVVREYPVPDDLPERVVMRRAHMSGNRHRIYHLPADDDPEIPACRSACRSNANWYNWPIHGVPGNFPPCTQCFDIEVTDD